MFPIILLATIVFPILSGFMMGISKPKTKAYSKRLVACIIGINLAMVVALIALEPNASAHILTINPFLKIVFRIDGMGTLFSLLVSILWMFTTFYSFGYMEHEHKQKRFFTFFTMGLGVTLGIAFSANLFTLYIFYEALTLITFPLVVHEGNKEAAYSGRKYLIYSFFGATLVLLGMILLFPTVESLTFVPGGIINNQVVSNNYLLIIFVLMFLGFGVKAAIFPFYPWLPAAMVAPTPVSSLLHAVAVVKAGIFALVRLIYYIIGPEVIEDIGGTQYLAILVGLTIIFGSLLAVEEKNLKKRLAYSTISQLGYIILGLILLNDNALRGGLLHIINHAVIKITLFFCVGAIIMKTGKKNIDDIKGLGREMPITMICFAISSFALMGTPPTNGFVSKWFLAIGGLDADRMIFPIILLVSALLTAAYLLPITIVAFFSGDKEEVIERKDPPKTMLIPIVILTGVSIVTGLFPNFLIEFVNGIIDILL